MSDASRKIAKIEYDYNNNPVRIQFTNGIDKYQFDDGYCQASAAGSVDYFDSYYYDRDHLGNVRRVIEPYGNNKSYVIQRMNYYPFGAEFCDGGTKSYVQNHKYNGKEFDHMHGLNTYDYGARQYNPVTGRWDRIDPLCEKYYSTSPYAYCENDPVNSIDPDGRSGLKVLLKAAYKIGKSVAKHGASSLNKAATYADAFSDVTDNFQTLTSSESSFGEKLWAGTCLASEILPVSVGDAKDAGKLVNKAVDAAQDVSGAQKTIKATKNNYRRVLQKATGKTGKGYEAHHSLPQKYRATFEDMGINIDAPGNVVWREAKGHHKKSYNITEEWTKFMRDHNMKPTKEDVYKFRDQIENKYFGNKSDIPNN